MSNYEHNDLFPDEAFDHDPEEINQLSEGNTLRYSEIVVALRLARRTLLENFSGEWNKEHEQGLAATIQAGLSAEQDVEAFDEAYDGSLDVAIEQGVQARHDLVVGNLPFAAYLARASAGYRRLPHTATDGVPSVPRRDGDYMGKLKEQGTYARLANLSHPQANLEDRIQVAMESMWKAAGKYKPGEQGEGKRSAKFTTYAAWWIHQALRDYSMSEVSGWDVDKSTFDRYMEALNEERLYGELPKIRHRVDGRGFHDGLHPTQMLNGRTGVSFDVTNLRAIEEADNFGEPTVLPLIELVPDGALSAFDKITTSALGEQLVSVLNTLSESEAGVISMRFGLDDGEPKTLDEIGKRYGLTRERIRQIESKTMSKLRHPRRSDALRYYLDGSADDYTETYGMPIIADGTAHIKTERMRVTGGRWHGLPEIDEPEDAEPQQQRDPNLKTWQSSMDDDWDDPIRMANEP